MRAPTVGDPPMTRLKPRELTSPFASEGAAADLDAIRTAQALQHSTVCLEVGRHLSLLPAASRASIACHPVRRLLRIIEGRDRIAGLTLRAALSGESPAGTPGPFPLHFRNMSPNAG